MAAAAHTQHLRIGSMVFDNDYRHPLLLAKEAATIDALSGGRFELGLGAGWLQNEYAQGGLPFEAAGTRIDRLEEAICVIKRLWSDEPLTFAGKHYRITGVDGVPKPAQRPHPPILVGGGQKRMLMLAGREADIVGVLTTSVATGTLVDDPAERMPEAVARKIAWIRQGAGPRFPAIELSLIPTVIVTKERRRQTEAWVAARGWPGISVDDVRSMPSVLIGTPEEIAEDILRRRVEYGFSYYVVSDRQMEEFAPVVERLAGR
jgi:probable F420-dependent oxidoreductase